MGRVRRPSRWRWVFWIVAGVVVIATVRSAWVERRAARDSPHAHAERVRSDVRAAQAVVDTCLERLSINEDRFLEQTHNTEALQERIRQLEAMDPRGVPADSYPVYLEAVDRYNEAIEGWGTRGDALEERQRECRALVEERNLLADSLRGLLVESGYLPATPPDVPAGDAPAGDAPPDGPSGDTTPPPGSF